MLLTPAAQPHFSVQRTCEHRNLTCCILSISDGPPEAIQAGGWWRPHQGSRHGSVSVSQDLVAGRAPWPRPLGLGPPVVRVALPWDDPWLSALVVTSLPAVS